MAVLRQDLLGLPPLLISHRRIILPAVHILPHTPLRLDIILPLPPPLPVTTLRHMIPHPRHQEATLLPHTGHHQFSRFMEPSQDLLHPRLHMPSHTDHLNLDTGLCLPYPLLRVLYRHVYLQACLQVYHQSLLTGISCREIDMDGIVKAKTTDQTAPARPTSMATLNAMRHNPSRKWAAQKRSRCQPESKGVDDDEADWKWEEEMIFKETDKPHQPDPIAKPLPGPEGYHDNIMLPPAWNATCIQSEFVTEENLVEFSRPVRETERFASMQLDPAFWRSPVDSKMVKQQPEVRDKPITFKSVRLPGFPSLPPKPPTPENRDYRPMNSRKRTWEDSPYKSSLAPGNQEGGEWADHRHKRHRGDSHSVYDTASPHNRRTREDPRPIDRYRSQKSDRVDSDPAQMLLKSLEDPHDAGPSRRHDGERLSIRQDSYARRRADIATVRNIPAREKLSGQTGFDISVSQSVASFASHGTEDSELSALEAELLGIAPKAKEGTEGKLGDHATKLRKRVQKVDSAYGRRW
ncbi:hypothetical protein CSHISOI_03761 [Colletotrichum shisoi]|uniref:Uncharacterized protein n=1 Tax=Colletotrichum shisoi TaxID=2078593 RepID=A0A5Q4BXI5_9PEZI|nr:hypothetical protein CSHISOI_03761 [Colletotrichum shisoi]